MMRSIDTNVFVYAATAHPRFGATARHIASRIEQGEEAATSTLVLCEVAWVLEAMGRQGDVKHVLEKILSYETLRILGFDESDLLMGASNMIASRLDFNNGVNVAIMTRRGICEVYSNDLKHLARPSLLLYIR